jgi:hypothetical protein
VLNYVAERGELPSFENRSTLPADNRVGRGLSPRGESPAIRDLSASHLLRYCDSLSRGEEAGRPRLARDLAGYSRYRPGHFSLFGTLAPERRASESPIAIACLRLRTFLPERPLLSSPRFIWCIARLTFRPLALPYLRAIAFFLHRYPVSHSTPRMTTRTPRPLLG